MTQTKLVIQDGNPNLFNKLKMKHRGAYLTEIARGGKGNELFYVIGDSGYEEALWQKDNELNSEGEELIGLSSSMKL